MVDRSDTASQFRQLYLQHYSTIAITCRRRLGDADAAEDAAAEVFRIAWQRYQGGTQITLPWLYRTARNVVGNEYRRQLRQHRLLEKAKATGESEASEPGVDTEVRIALARVKKAERELLFMAYWEDLTTREIAEIFRINETTVRMRLSRARKSMRAELEKFTRDAEHGGESFYG